MTTPDDGLAARLTDLGQNGGTKDPDLLIANLWNAFYGGQLITLADHTRLVKEAVEAERAAAKSMVWTLGHEIKATMLVEEDNEQAVLDMVNATAAAISARGVTG